MLVRPTYPRAARRPAIPDARFGRRSLGGAPGRVRARLVGGARAEGDQRGGYLPDPEEQECDEVVRACVWIIRGSSVNHPWIIRGSSAPRQRCRREGQCLIEAFCSSYFDCPLR